MNNTYIVFTKSQGESRNKKMADEWFEVSKKTYFKELYDIIGDDRRKVFFVDMKGKISLFRVQCFCLQPA